MLILFRCNRDKATCWMARGSNSSNNKNSSLLQNVETGSGTSAATYSMVLGFFPGDTAAETWS